MSTNTSTPTNAVDTLWYTRCPVPTPLGLAVQLGWFSDEFEPDGITLKTLQDTIDPALRESHYDHHLLNSFRQGGNVPALWARAQGADTRVIGLNWIDEYQAILSAPTSNIREPKDLRGRRLALPKHNNTIDHARAGALRGFLATLELGDVDPAEVEFVDIEIKNTLTAWANNGRANRGSNGGYQPLIDALLNGDVDAIFVKGSRGVEITQLNGAHVVTDLRNHPDPLVRANNGAPRPITVDTHLLETRPDIVARFLARIVDIGDWAAAHPAETLAYVSHETGSNEQWVKAAYGADLHLHQRTDLSEQSIAGLEAYKNFLFAHGFLKNDFDVRAWIDPRPLTELLSKASKAA
ncbi:MAG: ABC transporter substrate-binding protein [Agitococcus sp.]|nr:ABC transporter substrate-binding protein [Agitococcus sp.]